MSEHILTIHNLVFDVSTPEALHTERDTWREKGFTILDVAPCVQLAPTHVTRHTSDIIRQHLTSMFKSMSTKALKLNSIWATKERERLKRYIDMLDIGGPYCGYCFMDEEAQRSIHDPWDCPVMAAHGMGHAYRQFKKAIRFADNNVCCFKCGVISKGGDVLHEDYREPVNDGSCPKRNFVLGTVFFLIAHRQEWMEKRFGKSTKVVKYSNTMSPSWKPFLRWLFASDTRGGGDAKHPETRDGTNMFKLLSTYWHEQYIVQED